MKPQTRILLVLLIIVAPVIVLLLPAIVLYIQFGENYFVGVSGTIMFWFLGILVGFVITKKMMQSKTNTAEKTEALKV